MQPFVRKVLYATDLGEHNGPVYRTAMSLTEQCGAELTVLHVLEALSPFAQAFVEEHVPKEALNRMHDEGMERLRNKIRAQVNAFCREELNDASLADKYVTDIIIGEGQPTEVVLKIAAAKGVDLIVLGSHGRSTVGEILMGSTAHKVSQRSTVPVLLVPVAKE